MDEEEFFLGEGIASPSSKITETLSTPTRNDPLLPTTGGVTRPCGVFLIVLGSVFVLSVS
ncbi:MAG: hypothetical protein GY832_47460 [Chloroflexi bacterium]|nr:hypothetical protein [Chloroflexota bacterium]